MKRVMKLWLSKGNKPFACLLAKTDKNNDSLVITSMGCGFGLVMSPLWPLSCEMVMSCQNKVNFEKDMIGVLKFGSSKSYEPCICKQPEQINDIIL
mgnify:CR=1 FL=1